ncbi:MAG: 2-dehydro-3-deoxyphosphooctonate aldolase [Chlamydiae bacterium]|nr:2-dehydro-3-deoxyphosphooctonate aldolase [Chlamydiota bacterium]
MKTIPLKNFEIGSKEKLTVISGPCVIEGEEEALFAARLLKDIFKRHSLNFVFKASYDKANRTSIDSFRGPGLREGLKILKRIKEELDVPILTDVHTPEEAFAAAEVCDIIQIPAFLCRQTDLLVACAQSKAIINVKKGQFLAPWDMKHVVKKLESAGSEKIILVDRGTCFGYNNLVTDVRSIPIMQEMGYPVCFDASHSVQLPGGLDQSSGGQREFIPVLARAAIAAGANVLFIESHPNPEEAKSDKASVFPFNQLDTFLKQIEKLYTVVQSFDV